MGIFEDGRVTLELTLAARMGLAALLGFLIGLEREHRGKSAGERTFAIVALGAAGISGLAFTMFPLTAGQAVAGVATGIGFLGVGIIWRAEEGQTLGLTTAASILCVAAIGVIAGIGLYLTAVLGTALALFILEFDRMPGLRGLHRRVTGRPDDGRRGPELATRELAGTLEHLVQHRFCELAGERVLLARVEAAQEDERPDLRPRRGGRTAAAASPRDRARQAHGAPRPTRTRRARRSP